MAPGQDWCLQCGAGAPGSSRTAGWRSAAAILGVTLALVLGAAAAAVSRRSARRTPTSAGGDDDGRPGARRATTTHPGRRPRPDDARTATRTLHRQTAEDPAHAVTPTADRHDDDDQHPDDDPRRQRQAERRSLERAARARKQEPERDPPGHQRGLDLQPLHYPAAGFGDPSLAIDGDTSTGWTAAGQPGDRAHGWPRGC